MYVAMNKEHSMYCSVQTKLYTNKHNLIQYICMYTSGALQISDALMMHRYGTCTILSLSKH